MSINIKQVSSLEKIRSFSDIKTEISEKTLLKGEVFSFQQVIYSDSQSEIEVSVDSELKNYIKLYQVKETPMDFPCIAHFSDDDYITKEPGLMPDLLIPLEDQNNFIKVYKDFATIWAEVCLPKDIAPGSYSINIKYNGRTLEVPEGKITESKSISLDILNLELPEQEIKVTQWFHTDCIASVYNVPVYSEAHWDLIDKYMKAATEQGINMILTPVITPPLDTKPGALRPNTQLVKITKSGSSYSFDFSLLKRFIDLAKNNGLKYFEISHLFSQWGLKYSPNIYATENGEEKRIFGWHVPARDESYKEFLNQFLPELTGFLRKEQIIDNCYFHISDEPNLTHLDAYRYAYETVKPLLEGVKIFDALSSLDFYEKGLVSIPVTATNHIDPFLEKNIENQWAYYCCEQGDKTANRFLAMPSYRNRILGLQLYKYDIKGFLQWGFNFYYSQLSVFKINPYVTTSAEKSFPSGDPFSVYPGANGPLPSLRAKVFKEALQDISLCRLLEKYIGKENVVKFIEDKAEMEITFSKYPRNSVFSLDLDKAIKNELKKYI